MRLQQPSRCPPFLGAVADRSGIRRTLFITFTLLSVAATALLATVEPGMVLWGFLLGVLGNVGFEGARVYYNAWLPELAPPGQRGRLSGWGFAVAYAGAIVALPFLQAERYGGAFLAAAALFGGFALPAFVLLCSPSMCWSALGAAAAGPSWPSSLLASASGPCSSAWD